MKRVNFVLSGLVFLIGVYLLSIPLAPELSLAVEMSTDDKKGHNYSTKIAEIAGIPKENLIPIPQANMLIIPKIGVEAIINEGGDVTVLQKGVWRRPESSAPDLGGNTVFVAHRYLQNRPKDSFYHLPSLEKGDRFTLFWNNVEYSYEVFEKKEVSATSTYIEDETSESIITLYTCTPLLTSHNRIVIRARPINLL